MLFWWTGISYTKLDLPETFQVGSIQINVEYTINKYGTSRNGTVSAEELSEIFRSVSDELQEKSALFFVQSFCFGIYFKNHSLRIFDSQPKFCRISNYIRSFSFAKFSWLSVYIHQCYICNVGGGSDSNRELQYLIQFVNVSATQQFVSESLK